MNPGVVTQLRDKVPLRPLLMERSLAPQRASGTALPGNDWHHRTGCARAGYR